MCQNNVIFSLFHQSVSVTVLFITCVYLMNVSCHSLPSLPSFPFLCPPPLPCPPPTSLYEQRILARRYADGAASGKEIDG